MKDFAKVFLILVLVVSAFVFGRNYGEQTILESADYKTAKSQHAEFSKAETELRNTKEKLQNLLDSSDLKKAEEIYGKILTIFLVDLGLRLSESKQKDLDIGKASLAMCESRIAGQLNKKIETGAEDKKTSKTVLHESENAKEGLEENRRFTKEQQKFKSTEWMLLNSTTRGEILSRLEKVKLADLDTYIKGAPETKFGDAQKYFGSYRGKVQSVDGKDYGSLIIEIKPAQKPDHMEGSIKLYRNGREESSSSFTTNTLGYTPTGYLGTIVAMGRRFLQIYKLQGAEKIAGHFYERLPNGTSKIIGSFVLSRTDQF